MNNPEKCDQCHKQLAEYVRDGAFFCRECAAEYDRSRHISGAVYPAIETAYGRTVDHGFNVKIF